MAQRVSIIGNWQNYKVQTQQFLQKKFDTADAANKKTTLEIAELQMQIKRLQQQLRAHQLTCPGEEPHVAAGSLWRRRAAELQAPGYDPHSRRLRWVGGDESYAGGIGTPSTGIAKERPRLRLASRKALFLSRPGEPGVSFSNASEWRFYDTKSHELWWDEIVCTDLELCSPPFFHERLVELELLPVDLLPDSAATSPLFTTLSLQEMPDSPRALTPGTFMAVGEEAFGTVATFMNEEEMQTWAAVESSPALHGGRFPLFQYALLDST